MMASPRLTRAPGMVTTAASAMANHVAAMVPITAEHAMGDRSTSSHRPTACKRRHIGLEEECSQAYRCRFGGRERRQPRQRRVDHPLAGCQDQRRITAPEGGTPGE